MSTDHTPKVALITGGNSGIGKHTAIGLLQQGYRVMITSRDPERGKAALAEIEQAGGGSVECLPLDLARFDSIRECAQQVLARHDRLDVLVNNAGLMLGDRRQTAEGFEMTFGVNHLGHFLLTQLLLDRLIASAPARVVNLSSDAHKGASKGMSWSDLQHTERYSGVAAYCESKLANIYFTRELSRRLEGKGVTVNAVHPGAVASGFARDGDTQGLLRAVFSIFRPFMISEAKGARTSIYVATSPKLEGETGGYYAKCRPAKLTKVAQDDEQARKLWEVSESLIEQATAEASP
jgi:NAD(P)-dependent dehydrogenase (short-subunit alcohol dehydrogenase family)